VLSVVLTMIHLDDSLHIFIVWKGAPMVDFGWWQLLVFLPASKVHLQFTS